MKKFLIQNKKACTPLENLKLFFGSGNAYVQHNIRKNRRKPVNSLTGFTLVETLVAIGILTIGLTAPLTMAVQAVRTAETAQNQILSFYLAQEGIEYVRAVRSGNILDPAVGVPWLRYLDTCFVTEGSPCDIRDVSNTVDNQNDFRDCSAAGCIVRYNNGQDRYGGSGTETNFTRAIVVDDSIANEAEITVTVTWSEKGRTGQYVLTERMFNWSGN